MRVQTVGLPELFLSTMAEICRSLRSGLDHESEHSNSMLSQDFAARATLTIFMLSNCCHYHRTTDFLLWYAPKYDDFWQLRPSGIMGSLSVCLCQTIKTMFVFFAPHSLKEPEARLRAWRSLGLQKSRRVKTHHSCPIAWGIHYWHRRIPPDSKTSSIGHILRGIKGNLKTYIP